MLGTLAARERKDPVVVVSGDRDLLQLVRDDPVPVRVLYLGRGLAKATKYGPAEVAENYGVPVDRAGPAYAELALLRGDPSDGLPGVPGVGEKTAATLLAQHGSLEGILAAAHDPKSTMSKAYRTKLLAATDYIEAAGPVVTVATDADVTSRRSPTRCPWPPSTRARWPSSPSTTASRRRSGGCRRHLTGCPATRFCLACEEAKGRNDIHSGSCPSGHERNAGTTTGRGRRLLRRGQARCLDGEGS